MDYRSLVFYQKSRELVSRTDSQIKSWPKTMQAQEIARQLFRASVSIGANIAERHGRHNGLEYIHYLIIAQGSANEVDHWLNTSIDCGVGHAASIQELIQLNNEIQKMLTATINTLRTRTNKAVRDVSSPYSSLPYPLEETQEEL